MRKEGAATAGGRASGILVEIGQIGLAQQRLLAEGVAWLEVWQEELGVGLGAEEGGTAAEEPALVASEAVGRAARTLEHLAISVRAVRDGVLGRKRLHLLRRVARGVQRAHHQGAAEPGPGLK